jgi:hypothetical protein
VIECDELVGKTVKRVTVYGAGDCGPEANFEFSDGTVFNVCLASRVEAKLTVDEGGEPRILPSYTEPS